MRMIYALLLLVGMAWLGAGCASPSGGSSQAASAQYSKEVDGLMITVQPLTSAQEVKGVFGGNILRDGVLPIKLSTDNQNASASFIMPREKILVMNGTTGATNSSQRGATGREIGTVTAGQAVGAFAAAGAGPLLILVAALTAKDSVNPNVEHNLTGKEFFTRTLGPGQRAAGYIYCRFQKDKPPSGPYRILAEVKNAATGTTAPVEFNINIQLAKP